jgi:hypothetical protein
LIEMTDSAAAFVRRRLARGGSLSRWIQLPAQVVLAGLVLAALLAGLVADTPGADGRRTDARQAAFAVGTLSVPGSSIGASEAVARSVLGTSSEASVMARDLSYEFAWPADGAISTPMSWAHPTGIDIAATLGEAVRAVRSGVVKEAGGDTCCLYGYYVIVEHDGGWTSLYGHVSEILVEPGDRVEQGDVLGLAGDTGKATGVHLHFELWSDGAPVNPVDYLQPLRYVVAADVPTGPPAAVEVAPSIQEASQEPAAGEAAGAAGDGGPAVDAGAAIDRAVLWMEVQGTSGYAVDRATCFAAEAGPNWSVSCVGGDLSCETPAACGTLLEACVVGEQRLVEPVCSGY